MTSKPSDRWEKNVKPIERTPEDYAISTDHAGYVTGFGIASGGTISAEDAKASALAAAVSAHTAASSVGVKHLLTPEEAKAMMAKAAAASASHTILPGGGLINSFDQTVTMAQVDRMMSDMRVVFTAEMAAIRTELTNEKTYRQLLQDKILWMEKQIADLREESKDRPRTGPDSWL